MHHDGVPARYARSNEKLMAWQAPKFKVIPNSSPEFGSRGRRPQRNTVAVGPECRADKAIVFGISDQLNLLAGDSEITHQGNIRVGARLRSAGLLQGEQDGPNLGGVLLGPVENFVGHVAHGGE